VSQTHHQALRDDLEQSKALKGEIEKFFGASSGKGGEGFFEALGTFETGHTKVYQFVKSLHSRIPPLSQAEEKETKGIKTRKYSDPKYDNDEYMASIEQTLLRSLGIPAEPDSSKRLDSVKSESKKPKPATKLVRKYSDNKYDKPEFEAKIEQQTMRAVEALIRDEQQKQQPAAKKEKKNIFGLAFEIPDELQQILEKEMQQQSENGGKI
jgi:hypothetical protein